MCDVLRKWSCCPLFSHPHQTTERETKTETRREGGVREIKGAIKIHSI